MSDVCVDVFSNAINQNEEVAMEIYSRNWWSPEDTRKIADWYRSRTNKKTLKEKINKL